MSVYVCTGLPPPFNGGGDDGGAQGLETRRGGGLQPPPSFVANRCVAGAWGPGLEAWGPGPRARGEEGIGGWVVIYHFQGVVSKQPQTYIVCYENGVLIPSPLIGIYIAASILL